MIKLKDMLNERWKPNPEDQAIIDGLSSKDKSDLMKIYNILGGFTAVSEIVERTNLSSKRIIAIVKRVEGIGLKAFRGKAMYYEGPSRHNASKSLPGIKRDKGGKGARQGATVYMAVAGNSDRHLRR